jgi:hypothetical protein
MATYSLGDVLRRGFGAGRRAVMGDTEVGEESARASGMPEAAGVRPDIFKILLEEKGRKERGETLDPYKQAALDLRAKGLELDAEKVRLQGEKAKADAEYKDKVLNYKKDWLAISVKNQANSDPAFKSLSQAALKAISLAKKTPEDEAIIAAWQQSMAEQGYDIAEVQDDPDWWSKIKSAVGMGGTTTKPAVKSPSAKSTTIPKSKAKSDPMGLGL